MKTMCYDWPNMESRGIWIHIILAIITGFIFTHAQDPESAIHFQVTEQVADVFFGNVKASEYISNLFDVSQRDQLSFALAPSPDQDASLFFIDPDSGAMETAVAIDREEHCASQEQCFLYIQVSTVSPRFEVFTVKVEILDVNDFVPYFDPLELTLTFPENAPIGTGRSLPLARDLDSPINGVERYNLLTSSNEFELEFLASAGNTLGLRLVLRESLDRERISEYTLRVAAYDSADTQRRGELTVHVIVEDENDHSPVFVNASYTLHIDEDREPVSLIATVSAVDLDIGMNGHVTYSFSSGSLDSFEGMFSIDNTTGEVYLHQVLDYETKNTYNLEIEAKDSGAEPKSAVTNLNIFVIDINDNPPEITLNTFTEFEHARVEEAADSDTFLAHVRVSDRDTTGNNGRTGCSLDHPGFSLRSFTLDQYNIYTETTFDRELQAEYTLLIECHDLGVPRLETFQRLIVEVIDINDNRPVLPRRDYDVSIQEGNEIDAVLLLLNATDEDAGENARLTYFIQSAEILNHVTLDSDTGELRASEQFDYERLTVLRFEVHVMDNGAPVLNTSANVTIYINDVNDESPVFTQSQFVFPFQEEQPPARFIGQVLAMDADGYPHNQFTYSITNSHASLPFEINPETGDIISTRTFDREAIAIYTLEVRVTDTGNPLFYDIAEVVVDVTDVNDNLPIFIFPNETSLSFVISNKVPRGTAIFAAQAADVDIDQNANITYSISETNSQRQHFKISPIWGTITTDAEFEEINYHEYDLRLTARDNGQPGFSTSRAFTIVVDSRVVYAGGTASESEESDGGGGGDNGSNVSIIVAVSVISCVLVLSLVVAIAVIKLRERRKVPKDERLDDTPYDAERKDLGSFDGPLTPTDSMSVTSGRSSPLSSVDGSTHVSLHPHGQTTLDPQDKPMINSDTLPYYQQKAPQKTYLAQCGEHDTSGSTEDSGRGGSEEGGDMTKLQRESQGATPEIIADSTLPPKLQVPPNGYTVITHPVPNQNFTAKPTLLVSSFKPRDSSPASSLVNQRTRDTSPASSLVNYRARDESPPSKASSLVNYTQTKREVELPSKPSSLVNQRPREEGPPSYDSFLRRKNSKRKRVNFALDGVTMGDSSTDQLPNDMPYPLHSSCDDMRGQFKPQPKPLRSSLKKTASHHKRAAVNALGLEVNAGMYMGGFRDHRRGRPSIDSDHSLASVIV